MFAWCSILLLQLSILKDIQLWFVTQSLKCPRSDILPRVTCAMFRQGKCQYLYLQHPSVSHDGSSGKVSKRMTICCHGKRGPCHHHLLCLLCKQETFYLICVSLVSVSSFSAMQIFPSLLTPPTYPSLSSDGATAPLQCRDLHRGTKCNLGPNNSVS